MRLRGEAARAAPGDLWWLNALVEQQPGLALQTGSERLLLFKPVSSGPASEALTSALTSLEEINQPQCPGEQGNIYIDIYIYIYIYL